MQRREIRKLDTLIKGIFLAYRRGEMSRRVRDEKLDYFRNLALEKIRVQVERGLN